jgi:hypothetical protein
VRVVAVAEHIKVEPLELGGQVVAETAAPEEQTTTAIRALQTQVVEVAVVLFKQIQPIVRVAQAAPASSLSNT